MLGLECSRLARNNADWHRLLELCALSGTLICDEDGLYDPAAINDRLLLGLKGAISEAELPRPTARCTNSAIRLRGPGPAAWSGSASRSSAIRQFSTTTGTRPATTTSA